MKYITGLICFGVPCEEDSCGTWLFTKQDFLSPEYMVERDSDNSPFNSYGIECDKIIPYHADDELFNVATHTRAYLDMLNDGKFDVLKGAFYEYIQSTTCREAIFRRVYNCLKNNANFKDIHDFMSEEFGNAWASYVSQRLSGFRSELDAKCVSA